MANDFCIWDLSIHDLPDQQKRISSARKAATSPESVDKDTGMGVFPSSGKAPYQTSLTSCTCVDFSKRHLPCKHMYRLAMECGKFEGVFSAGENKNVAEKRQFSLSDAISEIEKLSERNQMTVAHMIRAILYNSFDSVEEMKSRDTAQLLSCPLILCHGTVDALTILQRMRKKDIVALLEKCGCAYDPKLKKSDLALWCSENASQIQIDIPVIYLLSFNEAFDKAQRRVYSYLLRKFEWDSYLKGDMTEYRFPHGSEEGDGGLYWFPDDEITDLLTKYNCNRCLHGFAEQRVERAKVSAE